MINADGKTGMLRFGKLILTNYIKILIKVLLPGKSKRFTGTRERHKTVK